MLVHSCHDSKLYKYTNLTTQLCSVASNATVAMCTGWNSIILIKKVSPYTKRKKHSKYLSALTLSN